jgi:ABC-2 type transport system ATP-binding protein
VDVELRQGLWAFIRRLNAQGHTIVLTTHYLEEAEQLCGRIAMMKGGRIVALDRKDALLRQFASHALSFRLAGGTLPASLLGRTVDPGDSRRRIVLAGDSEIEGVLRDLREAGCEISDLSIEEPDLEEVFVQLMRRDEAAS